MGRNAGRTQGNALGFCEREAPHNGPPTYTPEVHASRRGLRGDFFFLLFFKTAERTEQVLNSRHQANVKSNYMLLKSGMHAEMWKIYITANTKPL